MKLIEAGYRRNEFDKDTVQEANIYTVTLAAATATKITNAALTTFGIAAAPAGTTYSTTSTRYAFDTLVGNLPWASYSKFAYTQPRATSPSIPYASLPSSGAITLTQNFGAGNVSEVMYYGSITWLTQTTGIFNNVKRASATGGTSYAYTAAATGTFTNVIPVREYIEVWNRSGAIVYIGNSAAINATPTNAVEVADDGEHGIMLEPLQDLWAFSTAGGAINISEYR